MFEQFTKTLQDTSVKAQAHVEKVSANVTDFAKMEIANAMALSKSVKPEQAIQAIVKSAQDRQAFVASKSKEALAQLSTFGAQWTKEAESKGTEFAHRANGAVDTVFNSAKQGLGLAELATKNMVGKATKNRKG